VEVSATNFAILKRDNLRLLVNSPTTLNFTTQMRYSFQT